MIFYLIGGIQLAGMLVSSIFFAEPIREESAKAYISELDRQDWLVLIVLSVLWPLSLAAVGWVALHRVHRRWRTRRLLDSLGATYDLKEAATHD
jgi:hypothetical protein